MEGVHGGLRYIIPAQTTVSHRPTKPAGVRLAYVGESGEEGVRGVTLAPGCVNSRRVTFYRWLIHCVRKPAEAPVAAASCSSSSRLPPLSPPPHLPLFLSFFSLFLFFFLVTVAEKSKIVPLPHFSVAPVEALSPLSRTASLNFAAVL